MRKTGLSDLISNLGKVAKRFDYVVKTNNCIYAFETNFYSSNGSKLNETTRSYKMLAEVSKVFLNLWFEYTIKTLNYS
ncbi:DpnII family type II restriction endonuclease [Campylobacter devanensis]|uniref:DpnII family type II restriction endonuclease n=1 Tax=Campylobacter devanensis TaxID=3161138 RepID=UPI000A346CFF|nr:DpnII family type II restriction endonuclease [Campylobacter sp. P0187]